jgi:hypothetical protein
VRLEGRERGKEREEKGRKNVTEREKWTLRIKDG